jgi:outer membrane protein TolC
VRAADPETLTLEQAVRYALHQNRNLAQSVLSLRRSDYGLISARSAFSTRIRPVSEVGFSGDDDTWEQGLITSRKIAWGTDFSLGGRLTSADSVNAGATRRVIVDLTVRQPLFRNFGRMTNVEGVTQARSQLKAAQRTYHGQVADLVVEVVSTFETLIRLEGEIASDQDFYERMEKLQELTSVRERQGRATRVDSLRVDLQRGQAQSRVEFSRERLASVRRDFAELLGFPPDHTFVLVAPPLLELEVPDATEALRVALAHRLDYAQALHDYHDSVRGVTIARKSLYPDISLVTTFQRFGLGDSFSAAQHLDEDNWFVGLTADTDFNPVLTRAAVKGAQLDQESSAQSVRITELSIAREVQQVLATYRRAQVEMKIAGKNIVLAEKRARLARRLFEVGRGDNFSVTDAEEAYIDANTQLLQARADASVTGYRLLRTLGTLVEYPESLEPNPEYIAAVDAELPLRDPVAQQMPIAFRSPSVAADGGDAGNRYEGKGERIK